MSQTDKIVDILLREGQIDNYYCVNNKLTLRLGARICGLREKGWEFDTYFADGTKNFVYKVKKLPEPKQGMLI